MHKINKEDYSMNDITKIKVDGELESTYKLFSKNREFEKRAGGNTGSQSSVQPDWNQNDSTKPDYVKNRPFYTGDLVKTEIIPETTVTFSKYSELITANWPESFDLVDGQTYTISWDGTDYACTGILLNGATPVLGNLGILGVGDDTGEPFIIFLDQGQWIAASTESATEHMISISRPAPEVVKIDEKYLPFDITQYKAPIVVEKDPRHLSDEEKEHINDTFKSGGIVVLTNSDVVVNYAILTYFNFDKTSSHMEFTYLEGRYMYYYDSNVSVDIYSIDLSHDGISSIANFQTKYILREDPLSYFVLLSSTTDSTKKFKITVDDSGALTATEVT